MSSIRGAAGELRWGYHCAAQLRDIEISGGQLSATVVSSDDYKVSQRPLWFVLTPTAWKWPVESLQIEGATLKASVGSLE